MDAVIKITSDLRSNPPAYALMKYADYLVYPSTEVVSGIIYTTEYWIVNNTECDAALWMNSPVPIIYYGLHFFYLHSLCVERVDTLVHQ